MMSRRSKRVDKRKKLELEVHLPPEIQRIIVSQLPCADMLNYAKTNKVAHKVVADYRDSAFRVERVLSPFFSDDELQRFRQVQYAYKFLVSGSTALSFFTRELYEKADLDVYITPRSIMVLILLLESMEYRFEPTINDKRQQPDEVEDAVEDMLVRMISGNRIRGLVLDDGEVNHEYSFTKDIVDVFNFERRGKKIQVIAANSPLAVVLSFHSTVVMNVLSHSHAISLYPRLTFQDRIAIRNILSKECSDRTIRKYNDRGFEFLSYVDAEIALRGKYSGLVPHIIRRPGDHFSWTIPLEPIPAVSRLNFKPDVLFEESWEVEYDASESHLLRMSFHLEQNRFERPKSSGYCVADGVWKRSAWFATWLEDEVEWNIDNWHQLLARRLRSVKLEMLEEAEATTEEYVATEIKKACTTVIDPQGSFPHIYYVQMIPEVLRWFSEEVEYNMETAFRIENGPNGSGVVSLKIELTIPKSMFSLRYLFQAIHEDRRVRKCLEKFSREGRIFLEIRTVDFVLSPRF